MIVKCSHLYYNTPTGMICEQGGERIENTTLFGKYQVCRVLGSGRSGTVYLAIHKELEEYRAIKRVAKASAGYARFRQEALILKNLRHPGIPIIYDLEEDAEFSYLIEEYLQGDSLYALISDLGHFQAAKTIHYGIQICHLVYFLHIAKPNPILYLDLQPKNLLLCNDTVKLVDFDHSVSLPEAKHVTKRYGTVGCAAPEQYGNAALDERTDIYAIGAVLYYMLTGCYFDTALGYPSERKYRKLVRIIKTCLQTDPARRYQSVDELCEQLIQIQEEHSGVFKKKRQSSLTIAIAGTGAGVGTTHIAIGLASYLTRQGISVLYEEKNESGAVIQLADSGKFSLDGDGIWWIHGQPMLPQYGEAVTLTSHAWELVIQDYGNDWRRLEAVSADAIFLVSSSKPWNIRRDNDAYQYLGSLPGLALIYNHFCGQLSSRPQGLANGTTVFFMSYFPNPFTGTKDAGQCFAAIWSDLTDDKTGGCLRKLFGTIYGKIKRRSTARKRTGGQSA